MLGEGPARCTWSIGKSDQQSPHVHKPLVPKPKIMNTVLENIGNTPMVRINRITKQENIQAEIRKQTNTHTDIHTHTSIENCYELLL